jgi:iron complex outermembrane receptor protein
LFGGIHSTTEPVTRNPQLSDLDADQYSNELQLLGESFDGKFEWIVGAFWMNMDGSQKDYQNIVGPNVNWPAGGSGIPTFDVIAEQGSPNLPNIDVDNTAYALFGEGTWTFNEQWAFTGGVRQSWDEREMTVKSAAFDAAALDVTCSVFDEEDNRLPLDQCSRKVDEDFDKLTWRAALSWNPMDAMLVYGSVATGYRTGGFNPRGGNNFTLQPFDEETVMTYELGHKTDWELGNLAAMRTNLAIYWQDYDDIQKSVSSTNPDTGAFETYVINAAEADIWGVEFDVMVAPTDSLTLTLGYSYVDTEYEEWPRETEPGVIVDYSESTFEWIPENSLTASVSYVLPLDASIGEVSVNAFGYWQDDMDTNDDAWNWPSLGWAPEDLEAALDTATVDDYSVWNFSVNWRAVMGSSFDVSAWINNAFDEEYATGGLTVPESLGWVGFSYGAPQTYGATLRYTF